MREITVAESAGFCFGVSRSVEAAEKILAEKGSLKSFGELVHNSDVISRLEKSGMTVIESPEELAQGDNVIIRAHGVSKAVFDSIERRGANITDATCPKVMAIHKIVGNASAGGKFVIIIGMKNHPEVLAISGRCDENVIVENARELEQFIASRPDLKDREITAVIQTTQTRQNFDECSYILKKEYTNIEIFDTICSATFLRQKEAAELSGNCDVMIVIGGKHSANSLHLSEICAEHCSDVRFIERAEELDIDTFGSDAKVGITAGASTPAWIIKEVVNTMADKNENVFEEAVAAEATFDDMLEESLKPIYNGDRVKGIVAAISGTEITLDLGAKYSGFIPTSEFEEAGIKIADAVKIGDEVEAVVVRVNDVEGTAQLSKKRLDSQKFWEEMEDASEGGNAVEGTVTDVNKGGIVVNVKGVRVFVPASQSGLPREADMAELLKKNVKLKITEVNKARKRVVGSIRRAASEERKAAAEAFWGEIEVGKKYHGIVKSLTNYGAFVDIGGIDGMVHQSELSWGRIRHPSEVVSVGDEIDVYVIGFDKDARRISLGYKDPAADPWQAFTSRYQVGDVAEVKIVKLMSFGAFAEVLENVDGLIHISQLADHRVEKAEDAVSVGDVVEAKITAINEETHKISLSIRALSAPAAEEEVFEEEAEEEQED